MVCFLLSLLQLSLCVGFLLVFDVLAHLSRRLRESLQYRRGWSGGAKVLGNLPVLGCPTNLDYNRTRAYCACSRCGWGLFGHFSLLYRFSFLSPSLSETARYRLKYCLKGLLSPKQPTNQLQYRQAPSSFVLHPSSHFKQLFI